MTSELPGEWSQEKSEIYRNIILNNTSSIISELGFEDIRASIYTYTADEDKNIFAVTFIKCSINSREPNNKTFEVDEDDKYGLHYVLKNNIPTQIKRSDIDDSTSVTKSNIWHSSSRHWEHSLRYPVQLTTGDPSSPVNPDETERYLLIIDTSEDKEFSELVFHTLEIPIHFFLTVLKQSKLKASQHENRGDLPEVTSSQYPPTNS